MDVNKFLQHIKDTVKQVAQKAVTTPVIPVPGVNIQNLLTRPPGTFTPLDPGSMYGAYKQDPKAALMNTIMALSAGPTALVQPKTSYINGIEQGTRNILGKAHTTGAPSEKGIFEVLMMNDKGKKIGSKIYDNSASAQKAIERIALKPNSQAMVRQLDSMPGPDGLVPEVKPKPSTGGEIGGIKSISQGKYKTTLDINNENDMPYLKKIFSEDQIKDMKSGKMTNWRGESYEDIARINIVSGKPTGLIINDLNPTGGLFVDYTPQQRATAPLGENITTLDKTMNKSPDELVTIYRGVSKPGRTINPGDFITTSPEGAKGYGEYVITKKVKLSDILDDKREPLGGEYLYRPSSGEIPKGEAGLLKKLKDLNLTGK